MMLREKRKLSKVYAADAVYVTEYLCVLGFYGKHVGQWMVEDLSWKLDMDKNAEAWILALLKTLK